MTQEVSHLYIPDGAGGVDAGCPEPVQVRLIPIEGRQRGTELAVLILHNQYSTAQLSCYPDYSCNAQELTSTQQLLLGRLSVIFQPESRKMYALLGSRLHGL